MTKLAGCSVTIGNVNRSTDSAKPGELRPSSGRRGHFGVQPLYLGCTDVERQLGQGLGAQGISSASRVGLQRAFRKDEYE